MLLTLLSPIWGPWMLWRAYRRKEKPNWAERMGNYASIPPKPKGARRVWLHAVSVGEVVAALPILREVRRALPDHEVVLSVTTSSGHETARTRAEGLYDYLVYFPIDVARFQMSAVQRVRPDVVAIMETELWFNFLWAAKVFGASTLLINGRISDRSFPRSLRLRFFYRTLLGYLDAALMQSPTDVERIQALGAKKAEALGNCKFDEALEGTNEGAETVRKDFGVEGRKPVVVVGSTRGSEEEDFVLEAVRQLGPDRVQVIHAPRHLERVPELAGKVERLMGSVALRSKAESGPYLILDTYGELARVYAAADVVVIGGGFSNLGGQNLIQPLARAKPVIHGPHMQNFRDVAALADRSNASLVAKTPEELAGHLRELLEDSPRRQSMGKSAGELVRSHAGTSHRYAQAIAEASRSSAQ